MPSGKVSSKNGAENIVHVAGVRLRVTGSGNLDLALKTLDDVRTFNMLPITLSAATEREPTRIGNMRSQRICLHISVDEINEWFAISKIVFFAKASGLDTPH